MSEETTTQQLTAEEWREIGAKLAAPVDPEDVDFRAQSAGKSEEASGRQRVLCYMDARLVQDRLDEAVGPGAWSFRYEPLLVGGGEIQLAKGVLTIHSVVKEDVGDASSFSPSKGCVSDALKRAAVQWGIGRYLYDVEKEWVTVDKGKIPDATLRALRAKLPRPGGAAPTTRTPAREARQEARREPQQQQETNAEPTVPTPAVGDAKFWQAPAIKDHQLALVEALREGGYKTVADVVAYFNQLVKKADWLNNDHVPEFARGEAKWMSRALHKLATTTSPRGRGRRPGRRGDEVASSRP